ncbi:MAG: heparinase II/III domain-containing protein, partial [Opitutaceae bacterium]
MKRREFIRAQVALGTAMATPAILTRAGAQPPPASASSAPSAPAVFFPAAKVEAFRARLASEPRLQARWSRFIECSDELAAVKLMSFSDANYIPPGTKIGSAGAGRNANYPAASGQMRKLGLTLGLAWRVTGEERYAHKLREALLNCTGYDRWISQARLDRSQPWHSDLSTAGLTVGCAAAYEAIHGVLTPSERGPIAEGIARLGIVPAMDDWALPGRRYHALDSMGHNYYSICSAGAGIGALALLGDDARAPEWVRAADSALEQWIGYSGLVLLNKPANFDPAGAYYEGVHYASYACSHYLIFRLALAHARPQSPPARSPLLERMAEFFAHTCYPASSGPLAVNFGDSGLDEGAAGVMRMLAANGFSPGLARWYLDQADPGSIDPFALLYIDDDAAGAANSLPRSVIYPGIGWATMRSGWESDATLVAMKSGMYWNHAHADAGSFILFHAGKPLLIDPGYCHYSRPEYTGYYCQSRAHNLVLFNGQGQGLGREDFQRGGKFPGSM